jgi:macrolide transport system ATP-binding/permease protein
VDAGTVRRYGDGYSGFLAAKAAARARQARLHEDWRAELARNSGLLEANAGRLAEIPRKGPRGFSGAGAFRARSRAHGAMSRIRAAKENLRELLDNPVPPPPRLLAFTPTLSGSGAASAVDLAEIRVSGRLRLDALRVEPGERLLITGANGAGKSTLLDVISGALVPDTGVVHRPVRIGYLRQRDQIGRDQRTLLQAYAAGRPGEPVEYADELLGLGLFHHEDLDQPVRVLSAGQRRRLDLATIVARPTDLLLLDEPTNHLSPDLVEELEEALLGYAGSVVMVTHDRRIRATFDAGRLVLAGGAVVDG